VAALGALLALILGVSRTTFAMARDRYLPGFLAATDQPSADGFNTYLVAYRPGDDIHYFPTVPEFVITVGLVALEIIGYVVIVKLFPILSGGAPGEVPVRSRRER